MKSFIALRTLPFLILHVNFLEISLIEVVLLAAYILFWIVSLSLTVPYFSWLPQFQSSFQSSQISFDFDFCEGFCSSKLGITIIALNTISFSGKSCSHSLINLEISPINFLPAFPDGNRNRFFLQNTTVS